MNIVSRILSQFLLYVWVFAPYPAAELGEVLYLHANHSVTSRANTEVQDAHKAYLRTAILDEIGPDAFTRRIVQELQRPGISKEHLAACLSVVHDLDQLPEFLPYIEQHRVISVMLQILETVVSAGDRHFRVVVHSHVSGFLR